MATKKIEIVNGPSKFDIMVSLFDREEKEGRAVNFSLGWQGYTLGYLQTVISGVGRLHHHDGGWVITGRGKIKITHEEDWKRIVTDQSLGDVISFMADYSTALRRGTLVISE